MTASELVKADQDCTPCGQRQADDLRARSRARLTRAGPEDLEPAPSGISTSPNLRAASSMAHPRGDCAAEGALLVPTELDGLTTRPRMARNETTHWLPGW